MTKLIRLFFVVAMFAVLGNADQRAQGWCEAGNVVVSTFGQQSSNVVQGSFPVCLVTVTIHGSGLATLYSDNAGTPLSNPFHGSNAGIWFFYAANNHYDVTLCSDVLQNNTCNGPLSAFTIYDILLDDPASGPSGVTSFNGRTGSVTPQTGDYTATNVGLGSVTNNAQVVDPGANGLVARTGATTSVNRTLSAGSSKISVTNGNGVSGNPTVDGGYTSTDIVGLFTSCSGSQYLGADGACHTAGQSWTDAKINCGATGNGSTDDSAALNTCFGVPNRLVFVPDGTYLLQASGLTVASGVTIQCSSNFTATFKNGNSSDIYVQMNASSTSNTTIRGCGFEGNFINQTYNSTNLVAAINGAYSTNLTVSDCRFHAFGYTNVTYDSYVDVVALTNAYDFKISKNQFYSNWGWEILLDGEDGSGTASDNTLGTLNLSESNTATAWWDTMSAGFGIYSGSGSNLTITRNNILGSFKSSNYDHATAAVFCASCTYSKVTDNYAYALGNAIGTLSVTHGSATITGTNTQFQSVDVNRYVYLQNDSTLYQIASVVSATSITVSPVVARTTASGLTYQENNSGDLIIVSGGNNTIEGNSSQWSGDHAFDLSGNYNIFSGNLAAYAQTCGLDFGEDGVLGARNILVADNLFIDNQRGQNRTGAICVYWAGAGGALNYNYFTGNSAQDDNFYGLGVFQKYLFQLDSAHIPTDITYNYEAGNHLGYGTGIFSTSTASVIAGAFNYPIAPDVQSSVANLSSLYIPAGSGTAPPQGTRVWAYDAKNVKDDSATPGAACTGSGHGAWAYYVNGGWACN